MRTYIIKRILLAIPTLLLSSLIIFIILRSVPGSVIEAKMSEYAIFKTKEDEAAALAAIEHLLPPGFQSLGTRLDVRHIAALRQAREGLPLAHLVAVDGQAARGRRRPEQQGVVVDDLAAACRDGARRRDCRSGSGRRQRRCCSWSLPSAALPWFPSTVGSPPPSPLRHRYRPCCTPVSSTPAPSCCSDWTECSPPSRLPSGSHWSPAGSPPYSAPLRCWYVPTPRAHWRTRRPASVPRPPCRPRILSVSLSIFSSSPRMKGIAFARMSRLATPG